MNISDTSLTEVSYDLIEHIEKRRKKFQILAVLCILLSLVGLYFNLFALKLILRAGAFRLGNFVNLLVVVNLLVALTLGFIGIKEISFIKRWDEKLEELKSYEKRVFEEVFRES